MKKLFSFFIVCVMSFTFTQSIYAENLNNENIPDSLLIIGDSISTGYGLENYDDEKDKCNSYGNLLAKEYNLTDTYINHAYNGSTSADILEDITSGMYDDDIKNSDVIIITTGGNDILNILLNRLISYLSSNNKIISSIKDIKISKEIITKLIEYMTNDDSTKAFTEVINNYQNQFPKIANYIFNKKSDTKLYFQTIYNPFSNLFFLDEFCNFSDNIIKLMNNVIIDTCNQFKNEYGYKCRYIDVASAFNKNTLLYTNILKLDIHPTQSGHSLIFNMCNQAIRNDTSFTLNTISSQINESLQNKDSSAETTTEITEITTESESENNFENENANNNNTIIISIITIIIIIGGISIFVVKKKK